MVLGMLLRIFLYKEPAIYIDVAQRLAYDELIKNMLAPSSTSAIISYQLPYPKLHLLSYLSQSDQYIFHGSNHTDIDVFEPREQTLYNGQLVKAIFATTNPLWSVYYATFDRSKQIADIRNGCFVYKGSAYHFYSLSESTMQQQDIWTDGMIYILPRQMFRRSGNRSLRFDEWICEQPVAPIWKLHVSAEDFTYRHKVSVHKDQESLYLTYLKYKWRTRKR